jgi:probable HAF family extracellular repeat protein
MKRTLTAAITVITLFAALSTPVRLAAQEQKNHHAMHPRYRLIDLGTFGGVTSYINPVGNGGPYMNRRGMVVGSAMTSIPIPNNQNFFPCPSPPNEVFHAMEWGDDGVTDLGSLGDPNNCANALAINDHGESVGTSENGKVDPLTGVLQIRAVRWNNGQVENLGTFGGNHSFASAINNRSQVAGFALNTIPDPFSLFDFGIGAFTTGTQTRAFLWEDGHMMDLKTLGGPDAWATFVNEQGQVAGYSYTSSTPNATTGVPTVDPFLWTKDGGMIDLGTVGGTFGFPVGVNNRGQVIGQSNLAGDQNFAPFLWDGKELIDMFTEGIGGSFLFANSINDDGEVVGAAAFQGRPFDAAIWKDGVVTDLGILPGDCFSQAFVMNSRGQIAGNSATCDGNTIRAALWEDGEVFDLNEFIPPNSSLLLVESDAINDRGEIAGNGFPAGCTDFSCTHAFVLIPCDGEHSAREGCEDDREAAVARVQSSTVPIGQNLVTATESPTPGEIAARIRAHFGRNRGLGAWPGKIVP